MYGIISDVHVHNWSQFATTVDGVNSRLTEILDSLTEACEALLKAGGKNMYIAGDLFHVRGSIPPSVLNPTLDTFKKMIKKGIEFRIIPGNHDLEGKHSDRVSSAVTAMESLGCVICNQPKIFHDDNVVMLPWYDKLDDLRAALTDIRFDIVEELGEDHETSDAFEDYSAIIHAPLNGVLKNLPDHGLDPAELSDIGYYHIFCGHYHNHKNFENDVFSVGALTHQTWSDVDTLAGYLLIDDGTVTHHETNATKFVDFNSDWNDAECEIYGSNNYVRVVIGEADESELREIKEKTLSACKAKHVIVHARPKPKVGTRSVSLEASETLEGSIESWINSNCTEDQKAIYEECVDVLGRIGEDA